MRNFFKTVATVTIFSICEKFLGFIYRIYMSRLIGSEGIGLYQVALSVFALLLTISCSGTPVTVSRLMTKYKAENNPQKVWGVISSGLFVTLITTIPLCVVFLLFGRNFTFLFADNRCYDIFLVILPGLIFTSIYSILRGVFWGNKDFISYSIIELLEEICMIISGIVLISRSQSIFEGAFNAGVAVIISFVFSFLLSVSIFFIRKNKLSNPIPQLKPLLSSALPITAMRTASSLITSLISIILPLRLISSGITQSQAMSIFGSAVGQAIPILCIPTTLIGSFTLVLIPEISENFYKRRDYYLKRDVEKAIKFSTIITCFFVPIFIVCGEEIGVLVFNSTQCGEYLSASSFLMVFMSISTITTSMLNSIGLENKTLIYFFITSIFMIITIWVLPQFIGIYALLMGCAIVYILTSILNLRLISKNCPIKPTYIKFILLSFLSIIPTVLFGLMLEKILLPLLGTILTLFICATLIFVFHFALTISFNLINIEFIKIKVKENLFNKKRKRKSEI